MSLANYTKLYYNLTEFGDVMVKMELFNNLQNVWFKIDSAKQLVDEGKEVLCSNRLQGALTNLKQIIDELGNEIKEKLPNEEIGEEI